MDILDQAIIFAVKAHSGQARKGIGTPYIVHPMEAAVIASTLTKEKEVIAAAALHDTVEDTPTTMEEIKEEFGERIAALVGSDSENKREDRPAAETWKIRKQETIDFLDHATRDEQILVLSDKLSNIRAMYRDQLVLGDKLWERFNQKDKSMHEWYYREIAVRLTAVMDSPAYREYIRLVDLVFQK